MKNKKIIIVCSILLIIIILVIVYIKTDFLKTKEQLFWKYMSKNEELIQVFSNEKTKQYNKNFIKSSYINKTNISIETRSKIIKPIKIYIEEKGNNKIECSNTNVKLDFNNNIESIANIVKDENYYILNSKILENEYVGFENKNLKQLASELGIKNTTYIPDEITQIDYENLFSIKDEEKEYIKNTYVPILRKHVKNSNYTKNDSGTIELHISEKDFNELIIDVLEKIYNDETMLLFISKKIEIVNKNSEYTNTEQLSRKIKELSNKLQNKKCVEEEFISIIIYIDEKNVEKTEIVLKNNRTISVQYDEKDNSIIIKQYEVKEKEFNNNSVNGIINNIINNISEIKYYRRIEAENESNSCIKIILNFGIEKVNIEYNIIETLDFENDLEDIKRKKDIKFIDLQNLKDEVEKRKIIDAINKGIEKVI